MAAVTVLLSPSLPARERAWSAGEYYALLLFSVVGMLGLVASRRPHRRLPRPRDHVDRRSTCWRACTARGAESQEAALKYFLLGAFASAFLLYGIALLYGATGSTSLEQIAPVGARLAGRRLPLAVLGAALLLVGFGFKVAACPSTCGRPTSTRARRPRSPRFMAAGRQGGGLRRAAARLRSGAARRSPRDWQPLVAVLAIVTMIVGNLAALAQTNLKRMLAYSSIAHAGYMLVGFVAAPGLAGEAVLFYLVVYAAVNLGAFGVIAALCARRRGSRSRSATWRGSPTRRPVLAAALTVFLVSLTGIPLDRRLRRQVLPLRRRGRGGVRRCWPSWAS